MKMRIKQSYSFFLIIITILLTIYLIYFHRQSYFSNLKSIDKNGLESMRSVPKHPIIVVVACGDRLPEALNMIKSAIVFNRNAQHLEFIIIAEDHLKQQFTEKLNDWQLMNNNIFTYEILPLQFPEDNKNDWKKLFKPCASQRLFLPTLLRNIDSVLYMDSDTLFLSPVGEIWELFHNFNNTQFAGMAAEHQDRNSGWYNRFARHPYYQPLGVNSGVMLMNLTRMREFKWQEHILPIFQQYRLQLVWGDQDIINILFHFHRDKLYVFPCQFNYRADHCMYMNVCDAPDGVQILHGNRGYFHSLSQPIFKKIYSTIEEYQFNTDPYRNIIQVLDFYYSTISPTANSNCDKISDKFLRKPRNLIRELD